MDSIRTSARPNHAHISETASQLPASPVTAEKTVFMPSEPDNPMSRFLSFVFLLKQYFLNHTLESKALRLMGQSSRFNTGFAAAGCGKAMHPVPPSVSPSGACKNKRSSQLNPFSQPGVLQTGRIPHGVAWSENRTLPSYGPETPAGGDESRGLVPPLAPHTHLLGHSY